jgi:hypothetical protein
VQYFHSSDSPAAREVYGRVWRANATGRLYPVPSSDGERVVLDAMVRAGLLLPVAATPTSFRGYVALRVESGSVAPFKA